MIEANRIVIGIDPGAHGAIAVYDGSRQNLLEVFDIPTFETHVGKKKRTRLDKPELAARAGELAKAYGRALVMLEEVGPQPRDGAVGAFSFGANYGAVEMAFVAAGFRIEHVRPQIWKKALHVPAIKSGAVARADEIFPASRLEWRGTRGGAKDGRAEAAMIAKYGADKFLLRGREAA